MALCDEFTKTGQRCRKQATYRIDWRPRYVHDELNRRSLFVCGTHLKTELARGILVDAQVVPLSKRAKALTRLQLCGIIVKETHDTATPGRAQVHLSCR